MKLEQRMEQSEELLETNEENKRQVERSQQRVRQTQSQVNANAAQVQYCQAQLQQAIAARNAAHQRAAEDENGGSVSASYDAAVDSAREALSQANQELQEARREHIRANQELQEAQTAHAESSEQLRTATQELREISSQYAIEMGKTAQLMRMPQGHLASHLFGSMEAGQARVNDLRRRIAASLGIPMDSEGTVVRGSYAGGGRISRGGRISGGSAATGSSGYQSPYVKTNYSAPVTYTDPQTRQRVTKLSNRTVYENRNLDPEMVIPAGTRRNNGTKIHKPTTNLELMRDGDAPFVRYTYADGSTGLVQLELHHLTGEETLHGSRHFQGVDKDGSIAEIFDVTHDRYNRQLHLGTPSFRRGVRKEKTADGAKYEKFRGTYWKNRAEKHNNEKNTRTSEKTGTFISRIFGRHRQPEKGQQTFGGYDVDAHGFVHGDNHEAFLKYWEGYRSGDYEITMFSDREIVRTISPSNVEGINLGPQDIENPGLFWSQHERGGTKESFVEIASHIPEVRSALDSGRSLSDLIEDDRLGMCAALYFDPSRMTQVMDLGGFYEFQSNGRHRILAARELGYDIPVKVIGSRRPKGT